MSKGNNPNPALIEMRRKDAKARQEAYDKLSLAQKLELLNRKFPDGAKKQRARLMKALERSSVTVKADETCEVTKDVQGSLKGKKNSGYEKRSGEERGKSNHK